MQSSYFHSFWLPNQPDWSLSYRSSTNISRPLTISQFTTLISITNGSRPLWLVNFGVRVFDCCRCWLAARTRLNRICEDSEQVDGQSAPTQNSVSTSVSCTINITLYLNFPYFCSYTSTVCAQIWPLQVYCVFLYWQYPIASSSEYQYAPCASNWPLQS